MLHHIPFIVILLYITLGCSSKSKDNTRLANDPNVVYIFADDLGYGDLSCYNAKDIKTPNIDKIAENGVKFSDFYSASSVCSPARAALLTGRYPQRMGLNNVFHPESFTGMPPEELTLAELLKEKNYTTAIIGKWHLGHHYKYLPIQQGFDYYFGIPYSNDMASVVYMKNNDVTEFQIDQKNITQTYTRESLKFIEDNKSKPFFLYLAHNMPHVPLYASDRFIGTSERGIYGDVVHELDWSVGQILDKLEQLKLLENTIIIFSSDNGPWLVMEELGGSAGNLREGKGFTFEGGMRVPTVAMWKGKIPSGMECNSIASQLDWLPTIATLTGIPVPSDRIIDGHDISQILKGKDSNINNSFLYFDEEELQGFRKENWKVKIPYEGCEGTQWRTSVPAHDTLLFDVMIDPGEQVNLFPLYPEIARNLLKEMNSRYREFGNLPPSIVVSTKNDISHFEYLEKLN